MGRRGLRVMFWSAAGLLALSLLLTIIGGSVNNDAVLNTGIIAWLATSFLLFAWLVLWIWSGTRKY